MCMPVEARRDRKEHVMSGRKTVRVGAGAGTSIELPERD